MSSNHKHKDILLMRNGTSQNQRFIDALDPESIKLHDLNTEDWMRFALMFSDKVNYYDTETSEVSGDWSDFFINENEIKGFVEKLKKLEEQENSDTFKSNIEPHLTLFTAFLKLTSFSQERLNSLSKRHLDFYYKEVLKLNNKAPVEDKVHVLFELAKNASEVRIEQGTDLNGGKDNLGANRIYKTEDEIIVNKASVASLRNVFNEEGVGIKNALVANSFDGLGEDFPDDQVRWWPFGYPTDTPGATQDSGSYPNLPFAKTGFGISSPVLKLKEGRRFIEFEFNLSPVKPNGFNIEALGDTIEVSFSGEKEWISGEIITNKNLPEDFLKNFPKGPSAVKANILRVVVLINEGQDAIINYNKEVLIEPYRTTDPVVRFVVQNNRRNGYLFQQLFSSTTLNNIAIEVSVDSIQDIVVENDLGILDASKPFYPFGPQPLRGSNFFIGLPEILNKKWSTISVGLSWKDKPASFVDKYIAYRTQFRDKLSKKNYTLALGPNNNIVEGTVATTPIINSENHFTVAVNILDNGVWKDIKEYNLFDPIDWIINSSGQFETKGKSTSKQGSSRENKLGQDATFPKGTGSSKNIISSEELSSFKEQGKFSEEDSFIDKEVEKKDPEKFTAAVKEGFVRVTLNKSFLHELFPRIFSVALSKENTAQDTLIPNEPYTPQIETLKIGYKASDSIDLDKEGSGQRRSVKLFHEHPFGISEENKVLKNTSVLKTNVDKAIRLLPAYKNGELYIALENAENLQNISLLVQTLEGSENPETTNDFNEGEKLGWSVLCTNEWLSLNADYITSNNTDNFLKTGIVKFSIPKEATKDNTKLPSGYFWLKVNNPRDFDTVSQLIDIKTQAVLAKFENNNIDLSHLQYGISAGTISKLTERLANVKGVSQDYGSFDGKPKETDPEFYRRISERLRHKQRATTLWDYEHLVLQEFPDIYKVKCLNHASQTSFLSPGDVQLVTIPSIINQNVYDPYKPRISKAKRNKIQDFINQLNTLHVTAQIINPVYEEVKVILRAKFYEGKDESFYTIQLQKDIAKLLAPWAFEETAIIDFGITLHESLVINYIEKLNYVDYIADFQLLLETGTTPDGAKIFTPVKKVVPSSIKAILTSVKFTNHQISVVSPEEGCTAAETI